MKEIAVLQVHPDQNQYLLRFRESLLALWGIAHDFFQKILQTTVIGTYTGFNIWTWNCICNYQWIKEAIIAKKRIAITCVKIISASCEYLWLFAQECITWLKSLSVKGKSIIYTVNYKCICIADFKKIPYKILILFILILSQPEYFFHIFLIKYGEYP